MDYSASVWGFKNYPKIITVNNRILKYYIGVHKCTSTPVIQGDTSLIPPHIRRKLSMLRLWKILIYMNENRITKRIFNFDFKKCRNNWSKEIKQIFDEMDKRENFINKSIFHSRGSFIK